MLSQVKEKKKELMILIMKEKETSKIVIEEEEISKEKDMSTILIKKEAIILDHIAKEEIEIVSCQLAEEKEEITITKKGLIFTLESLDTKLQIIDLNFKITTTFKLIVENQYQNIGENINNLESLLLASSYFVKDQNI